MTVVRVKFLDFHSPKPSYTRASWDGSDFELNVYIQRLTALQATEHGTLTVNTGNPAPTLHCNLLVL